ncbi:MAG: serine protease [Yoonia sp.]|uniref:serine protease n=1 Tax=Yoonia sp. TaxID=2212373 RepID=UPI003EF89667
MLRAFLLVVSLTCFAGSAQAQDRFWVQIEARPTLSDAQDRARSYARRVDNVNGFALNQGPYAIVLGPYSQGTADSIRARLLARGAIPPDSFVTEGGRFRQQFWPVGTTTTAIPDVAVPQDPPPPVTGVIRQPSDETPEQARESEAELTRSERERLQTALQWAGFYDAAIDGSFGRGTRSAMQAWQAANGYDPTGILTTGQRAALLRAYNAILEPLRMRVALDEASGIQMMIPTASVSFTEYQPPFVKFEANSDIAQAQVLFISQEGSQGRLQGLFEVLQILDIVPPEGPRSIDGDRFVIEGIGDGIHTYATATLRDEAIKGFIFVWPEGDEDRRSRVLGEMLTSFTRLEGTLDPNIVPATQTQSIDMVAGLAVRQPKMSRSGFYVSDAGHVITTTAVIAECDRITFDREEEATVLFADTELGIALMQPETPSTPLGVAALQSALPRLQDRISVAGYPFDGVLGAPTLTFGELVDIRNLTDDPRFYRLSMLPQPGDAGGAILNDSGAVLGMLLPDRSEAAQILPEDVKFAVTAREIADLLTAQGVTPTLAETTAPLSPVALTRRAADVAVLVSCW